MNKRGEVFMSESQNDYEDEGVSLSVDVIE